MKIKKTKVKTIAIHEPDCGLVDYVVKRSKIGEELSDVQILSGDWQGWAKKKKNLMTLKCDGNGYILTRYLIKPGESDPVPAEKFHLDFCEVTYLALILAEIDPENLTTRIRRSFRVKKPKSKKP